MTQYHPAVPNLKHALLKKLALHRKAAFSTANFQRKMACVTPKHVFKKLDRVSETSFY